MRNARLMIPAFVVLSLCAPGSLDATPTCPDIARDASVRLDLPFGNAVSGSPRLVAADLDHDGAAELVAFDRETGSLHALWGRRDRDFRPLRPLRAPAVRALHAAVNFQGVGATDLFVETDAGPTLLLGDGHGAFRGVPVTGVETSTTPSLWQWADLDGDGRLDVVLVESTSSSRPTVLTFRGDGSGRFTRSRSVELDGLPVGLPRGTIGLSLVDLDRDGRADAVVTASWSALISVRGVGDGSFRDARVLEESIDYGDMRLGDLDGDGWPDLVTWTRRLRGPRDVETTARVHWGAGDGTFPTSSEGVVVLNGEFDAADLDGDGRTELLVSQATEVTARRFLSTREPVGLGVVTETLYPTRFVQADLDGDGRVDLVAPRFSSLAVALASCGGFTRSFAVPVVLDVRGLGGRRFSSEIVLTNRGETDADVSLTYIPAVGSGAGTATLALSRGRQVVWTDVLGELRARGVPISMDDGAAGSLRVRFSGASSPSAVSAQARTRSSWGPGEVGVGFDPLPVARALVGTSFLPLLEHTSATRTNLAFIGLGDAEDETTTLRVTLFSGAEGRPGLLVLPDVTLGPGQFRQLDGVLRVAGATFARGWARIERIAGSAPYFAYAVLNDAASGDGVVLPARAPDAEAPAELQIPAIAETSRYTTEITVTNTGSGSVIAFLTVRSTAIGGAEEALRLRQVVVPPQGQVVISGSRELCGVVDPGKPCVGSMSILPSAPGLLAVSRTRSSTNDGRPGLGLSAAPRPETIGPVFVDGLRQDETHHTNLGLVSVLGTGYWRVELFDGDTGSRAAGFDVEVPRDGSLQLDSVLGTFAPGVRNGYARISPPPWPSYPVGISYPVIAFGVLMDGRSPAEGNGDGTYLPMSFVSRR